MLLSVTWRKCFFTEGKGKEREDGGEGRAGRWRGGGKRGEQRGRGTEEREEKNDYEYQNRNMNWLRKTLLHLLLLTTFGVLQKGVNIYSQFSEIH